MQKQERRAQRAVMTRDGWKAVLARRFGSLQPCLAVSATKRSAEFPPACARLYQTTNKVGDQCTETVPPCRKLLCELIRVYVCAQTEAEPHALAGGCGPVKPHPAPPGRDVVIQTNPQWLISAQVKFPSRWPSFLVRLAAVLLCASCLR